MSLKELGANVCTFFDKWKALHRIIALTAAGTLTYVFVEEAKDRTIDWTDYIAYAIAMVITYSTTLAAKALDALVAIRTGKACASDDGATAAPAKPGPADKEGN